MKRFAAFAVVVSLAASAHAAPIVATLQQTQAGATTSPFVFDGQFDTYIVVADNPNDEAVTSLELSLDVPNALNLADITFKAGSDNPIVFGFEAPDTFFVVPGSVDVADVLAVDTTDDGAVLRSSFTVAGGAELIPGMGSATIATINVPAGSPVELPLELGRAAIGGQFETVVSIPEPTTVMLAGLALAGFAARRR